MNLTTEQWVLGILGAILIGLGKGGLPGLGNLTIWLYAIAFGAKSSVGFLLPVLICGDIMATYVYWRSVSWQHVWRLIPWAFLGVVVGFLLFQRVDNAQMRKIIGGVLIFMTALHFLRLWLLRKAESHGKDLVLHHPWFVRGTGILGGMASMMANAAGPIAAFYLMAIRLPKFIFIGTAAWFYFLLNLFKLPFQAAAGNLNISSLSLSLLFGLFTMAAVFVAPKIIKYVPQKQFEYLVWFFIVVAGFCMLL